ncbi:MAG TPA: SCO family protein [Acidimicrobiales bacterium]|nr:SCO family protein [Acidimicrobiales bacterium]
MVSVDDVVSTDGPSARPAGRRPRRALVWVLGAVVLAGSAAGLVVATGGTGAPGAPGASWGVVQNRAVPASVLRIPLVDQNGRARPLASFGGRILVLTPFMTSCQETCPITTGAFLQMRADVRAAGLGGAVTFAEVSIDPGRDVPSRMAAYAQLTGADWPLLTGTAADLAALWRYFGVFYQRVPEDDPPGVDWQTGRPYTYDVNHTDGFIVLDPHLHERFATGAAPDLAGGRLAPPLAALLDDEGRHDLAHPAPGAWTVPEGLDVVGWVAGRTIPRR